MPVSQATIDKRLARRAAPPPPAEPFENGVGRDVYVTGLVGDLLQVVGALDADVLRVIAEYYVDGGQVTCFVTGLGYEDNPMKCKLTTQFGHAGFMFVPIRHIYMGSSGLPPVELIITLRNPTTGWIHNRVLLHPGHDVGSLLHALGLTWHEVLDPQFHVRFILHIERRFRHLPADL
jgi:hypothetical protein